MINFFKNIIKAFGQPFPDRNGAWKSFVSISGVGLFVFLFLFLLQPFGLNQLKSNLLLICVGFGVVTIVFGSSFDLISRYVFQIKTDGPSWTLGKWIIFSLLLLIWIALGNFIFMNALMDWRDLSLIFFINMIGNTLLVGVFPVLFSGLMIQMAATKSNEKRAAELGPSIQHHRPVGDRIQMLTLEPKDNIRVGSDQILYIEAMQNYVAVNYKNEGQLRKELLRNTLSNLEIELEKTSIVRCHRSYAVNINEVIHASGNAQGLKLKLKNFENLEVPVSRTFIPIIRKLLNENKD